MPYFGGKSLSGIYQKLINMIPPHNIYIEPFLGGGAVMKFKKPAIESIGIDADEHVVKEFECEALPRVYCTDALHWLNTHSFPPDAFIYLDPPYPMETRTCQRPAYRYEFTDEQHKQLLGIIKTLDCMVMISSYMNELYAEELKDWRLVTFSSRKRNHEKSTECVWMNYPEPIELHDYRYLGETFRDRQNLKRKGQRWKERLANMNALERYALMNVIGDLKLANIGK